MWYVFYIGHVQCYIVPVTFIEQRTFQIHGVNIQLNFDFVSIRPGISMNGVMEGLPVVRIRGDAVCYRTFKFHC
jgi:hypothetical protein